jgi:hypothetical protein
MFEMIVMIDEGIIKSQYVILMLDYWDLELLLVLMAHVMTQMHHGSTKMMKRGNQQGMGKRDEVIKT